MRTTITTINGNKFVTDEVVDPPLTAERHEVIVFTDIDRRAVVMPFHVIESIVAE